MNEIAYGWPDKSSTFAIVMIDRDSLKYDKSSENMSFSFMQATKYLKANIRRLKIPHIPEFVSIIGIPTRIDTLGENSKHINSNIGLHQISKSKSNRKKEESNYELVKPIS